MGAPLKGEGTDCLNFLYLSWKQVDPDFADVKRPSGHIRKHIKPGYKEELDALMKAAGFTKVEVEVAEELERGDWLFFQWTGLTLQTAMYLGEEKVLASMRSIGVREYDLEAVFWQRLVFVYRKN